MVGAKDSKASPSRFLKKLIKYLELENISNWN